MLTKSETPMTCQKYCCIDPKFFCKKCQCSFSTCLKCRTAAVGTGTAPDVRAQLANFPRQTVSVTCE